MTSAPGRRLRPLAAALTTSLLLVSACSGGDDEEPSTPEDALAEAKTQLDETSGVQLTLAGTDLPADLDALVEASGVGTHAPAFEGTVEVQVNNLSLKVPVVAVEGLVMAKLPATPDYVEIEPGDFSAPDPADLMDTSTGISSWLTAAEGVEAGDETRDGDKVLTTYTGTLSGKVVSEVIPSAATGADFDVTFSLDDEDRLAAAQITGPFYEDGGDVTYEVTLDEYDVEKDITRP